MKRPEIRKGKRPRRPPPRWTLRQEACYRPLQPLLPLQELLPALSLVCSAFTGTEQPPLPLQEFLPAQPASPPEQPPRALHSFLPLQSCLAEAEAQPPLPLHAFLPSPPWPLQALWPLQTCLSAALASAFFSSPAKALLPASIPAATAPITLVNSLRSM